MGLAIRLLEKGATWASQKMQQRVAYDPHNAFLEGLFAPVPTESACTETELRVTGAIPKELAGVLARIGPNPMRVDNPATYNWFMGDGMVHGLRLENGRALWYRNRFVGTDSVNAQLGCPPAPGPRRGITDVVNTNIIGHAGKLWALVEAGGYPAQLDEQLNTVKHGLFGSRADSGFTAHPHRDPDSGELHAITYDFMQRHVHYLVIDRNGQLRRDVAIPMNHGPMIHDSAITRSSVVILDLPVTRSFKGALAGDALPYRWDGHRQARIGLLPREGQAGDVRWFSVDACYAFHIGNAFEADNGDTVVDLVVHSPTFYRSRQAPEIDTLAFERWTLPAGGQRVQRRVISGERQEFPRLDERRTGKPYRYAYAISITTPEDYAPNALLRHDLHTGETLRHAYGPKWFSSEVIFVPRHTGSAEDEGWLMSYVHDVDGGPSRVVILDAQKLGGEPQTVIELPVRVPLGFHGNWIPDQA